MNFISINLWWESLSPAHQVFWFIAVVFSVLFLIQFVLLLIGLDADSPDGFDQSFDHVDTGIEFSALSVRSIIAFFTFFGWTGVLALHNHLGVIIAVAFASATGLMAMFLVAYLIFKFAQLEQSGTLNIKHALEKQGEVYLTVPGQQLGQGKIHIMLQGSMRELDAVTDGEPIRTGAKVKVVDILEKNILKVEVLEVLPSGEPSNHISR